ncbi:MAG: ATPase, partial [Chloroflexi bacterium]|nr:ATPase [Chloroflexota bacterium]
MEQPLNKTQANERASKKIIPWPSLSAEALRIPLDLPLSDTGNAKRFVLRHGSDVRFCHPWRRWLVWNGRCWVRDNTGEILRRGKRTVEIMYEEALLAYDRKSYADWAVRSDDLRRINAMIRLAESEPEIPVLPGELDCDSWLLTVDNGTIDLRTGDLHQHRREDLITKCASVAYDVDASCEAWLGFLDQTMGGDKSMLEF